MTMKNLWKVLLLLLCTGYFTTACSDDDDNPLAGVDNHVLSFYLEKGENKWQAAIVNNEIVLTVPEKIELKDAKANYQLSELATISPDPASITAWDEEQQFTVTSYNGTTQIYKYTIQRSAVSETGNFTFNSQAEVDAFAENHKVSVINGNVYIATTENSGDPITNLDALKDIKEITYALEIGQYYQGTNLAGLSNLEKIGSLTIKEEANTLAIETISLPKLISVGEGINIDVRKSGIKEINMPLLHTVLQTFQVEDFTLEKVNLNSLELVGGDLLFNSISTSTPMNKFTRLELPALKNVTGIFLINSPSALETLSLPVLESCGGITLYEAQQLNNLVLSKLSTANGQIYLYDCQALDNVDQVFQSLQKCNQLWLRKGAARQINVKGKDIGTLTIQDLDQFKIIGDDTFAGTLDLWGNMPEIEGISKIGGLTVYGPGKVTCSGITAITGNLTLGSAPSGKITEINMPDLTSLGGYDASKISNSTETIFNCPELTSITGDFILSPCGGYKSMEFYKAPKLKSIGGTLTIGSFLNNRYITNLDCFENLTSVGKVEIQKLAVLTSFKGLKAVADNMQSEDNWWVTGCAYNPKLSDMKAGNTESPANK